MQPASPRSPCHRRAPRWRVPPGSSRNRGRAARPTRLRRDRRVPAAPSRATCTYQATCRARRSARSRRCASRSSPNSRKVSSNRYRGSSRSTSCTMDLSTRLASRSATLPESSPTAQMCSAARRSKPPTKVASRAKSCCSDRVRSSYDHSSVSRSVRWRPSAPRCDAPSTFECCRSRSASADGPMLRRRAAASSSASGRPSSRRQISATAAALSAVERKARVGSRRAVDEQLHGFRRRDRLGRLRRRRRADRADRPATSARRRGRAVRGSSPAR